MVHSSWSLSMRYHVMYPASYHELLTMIHELICNRLY